MRGVFDGTNTIEWERHQYKNDATTAKKHANNIILSNVAFKNNYMYGKILINEFVPLRPVWSLLKWIDLS